VNLGPKVIELKASYFEKREEANGLNGLLDDGKSQRYFDLLATSSYLDGKMVADGELAYSALDSLKTQCHCDELPRMLRLGLKHRWGDLSYGADYRSLGKGFVSITGAKVDQARDEGQVAESAAAAALHRLHDALRGLDQEPAAAAEPELK